jgi:hypothetical protein
MNESTRLIKIEDPQECRVIERNALLGHHTRIDYLPVDGLRSGISRSKRWFYAWVRRS